MSNLRNFWPVIVQAAGIALLSIGFGLLATWAGLAVGGAGLTLMGLAAEVGRKN